MRFNTQKRYIILWYRFLIFSLCLFLINPLSNKSKEKVVNLPIFPCFTLLQYNTIPKYDHIFFGTNIFVQEVLEPLVVSNSNIPEKISLMHQGYF